MQLTQGVAFVITHQDGSKELHVFTGNGTLKIPDTMVRIEQIGPTPAVQLPYSGSYLVSIGGGGGGSGGVAGSCVGHGIGGAAS